MIVDADMGMPIDLSQYPRLWDPDDTGEDYGEYQTSMGNADSPST